MTNQLIAPTEQHEQDNALAFQLNALGIYFLSGNGRASQSHPQKYEKSQLVSRLASSPQARFRLALIPLFLKAPHYAPEATACHPTLYPEAQITLMCYYTAAHLLQKKHRTRKS